MTRLLLATCLLAAGCGGPPPTADGRAAGVVTLDDQPVAGGKIDLVSDDGSVSAPIGPDGRFTVPSLPAGRYRVAVGPVPPRQGPSKAAGVLHQGDNEHPPPRNGKGAAVPKKYHNPATSGLAVDIAHPPTPLDIKLSSK